MIIGFSFHGVGVGGQKAGQDRSPPLLGFAMLITAWLPSQATVHAAVEISLRQGQ